MKKTILAAILISAISFLKAQNPVLIKNIDTTEGESSKPSELTSFNNKLYFVADAERWNGFGMVRNRELWSSNGSESGTTMVIDLNKTASDNSSSYPLGLHVWKNKLYFFATGADGRQNLYETDGTEANTKQITTNGFIVTVPFGIRTKVFTEFNNALYFIASDWTNGYELWKTDGTTAGTVMVKDINPSAGMLDSKSDIHQLTVMGDKLYFFANDQSNNDSLQIWRTDGTTTGTEKVLSYRVDGSSTELYSLTGTQTHLYFTYKKSIYKSDGTAAGTSIFMPDCDPYHLTAFNNQMLFEYYTNNPYTPHIAITSSDPNGYTVLKDVSASAINSTYYMPMNVVDNKLFFNFGVIDNSTELWMSDGTVAGTTLIKTIPQSEGGIPSQQFIKHKNEVYFLMRLNNKSILHKTDGTDAGTIAVSTISVDDINNLTSVDNVLFFSSDDNQFGQKGEELWKFGTDTTSGGGGNTAVEENKISAASAILYPNPAQNEVTISMNETSTVIVDVTLFDITGKMIERINVPNNSSTIKNQTNTLNEGQYFYQIKTTESVIIKKMNITR